MSVSKSDHASLPWRIHAIANDFRVEDVWALPTPGGANDFPRLVALLQSFDSRRSAPVVRALFAIRWKLGAWLGLDGDGTGIGSRVASVRERLPVDLADTARDDQSAGPFTTLYVTDDEAALEIANRTVHGVLHPAGCPPATADTGARWPCWSSRTESPEGVTCRPSRRFVTSSSTRPCFAASHGAGRIGMWCNESRNTAPFRKTFGS